MTTLSNSLLIIVVLYETFLEDSESFQSLKQSIYPESPLDIIVYDNSAKPQELPQNSPFKLTYIHDSRNSGVSRAYNHGATVAEERRREWILLLDQDTSIPPQFLDHYGKAISENPGINLFAPVLRLSSGLIFSPFAYKFHRGFHIKEISEGIHSLYKFAPVNSGMMIRVKAFMECGGYNEKVRLDFSDFQFVRRFRKIYPEFFVLNTSFLQDFSDKAVSMETHQGRFRFYCEGALAIEKENWMDRVIYAVIVFARASSLSIRFKTTKFLGHYFKYYFG
jgi:GT2 family glycosyltransferase